MRILLLGPDWRNQRIIDFLEARNCHVISYTDVVSIEFLVDNKINFIISNGYAPIIKEPIITEYWHRIINLHPTYLPYGKGIFPNFWSFFEATPTGVSIHFIDACIDTGDILYQKRVYPLENDTLRSFYDRLLMETEILFFEKWDEIINKQYTLTFQKDIPIKVRYRSRIDSERFMEMLPKKWDTPITDVEELGADFFLSEQFWEKYLSEVQ